MTEWKRDPIPYRVSDSSDEVLIVGYPRADKVINSLTLSPLGVSAAFHPPSSAKNPFALLAAFIRREAMHWRSIGLVRPFYWPELSRGLRPGDATLASSTHALALAGSYDTLFENSFKGATRTCIRRAESEGVRVELRSDAAAIAMYYSVHKTLATEKGGYGELYPEALFRRLGDKSSRWELLAAFAGERMIAGGVFVEDGPTTFYWHAASDRAYAKLQPAYAVLSEAIRRAIDKGKSHFNFGASAGIDSLIRFKEAWGAREMQLASEVYRNPLVRGARALRDNARELFTR